MRKLVVGRFGDA
jgi:hypothetical protein